MNDERFYRWVASRKARPNKRRPIRAAFINWVRGYYEVGKGIPSDVPKRFNEEWAIEYYALRREYDKWLTSQCEKEKQNA